MSASDRRRAAVLTVSDGVAAGVRDDASGRALVALLVEHGFEVAAHEVVPDERGRIEGALLSLAAGASLVLTTGGTGLGPRDVTPEATRAVVDREAPGLAEEMRSAGRASTPFAALSRGVAGSRGAALLLNLPGSERGAVESLTAVLPLLPHALDLLAGETAHGPGDARARAHAHGGRGAGGEAHAGPAPGEGGATPEEALIAHVAAGDEVVLVTAVRAEGAPPCRVGQKVLMGRDGPLAGTLGCAEFDAGALEAARAALDASSPGTRVLRHDLGSIEVYAEPHAARPLLLVLAATPVAAALIRWGAVAGFEPMLVEPRGERLRALGSVAGRTADDPRAIDEALERAGERLYAVHTDHDAPDVEETLARLLRSPAAFVGVMGSARHVGGHVEALRAMGFGDADLARVRSPVGLDLGARTPDEIALSILAGLVAARNGRDGGWLDRRAR